MGCRAHVTYLFSLNLDSLKVTTMRPAGISVLREPAFVRFGVVSGSKIKSCHFKSAKAIMKSLSFRTRSTWLAG